MARDRKDTLWKRLRRLLHFRLVIPLKRNAHPPEYTARGVAAGIFWALTPLIPVQMYLLGLTWLLARLSSRTDFNVLVALAWIWVTNAFTMVPFYFVFYVTGQILLGRWGDFVGYGAFSQVWQTALTTNGGVLDTMRAAAGLIIEEQGLTLGAGCLPYAVGGAWLGYSWSLRVLRRFMARRRRRIAEAAAPSAD